MYLSFVYFLVPSTASNYNILVTTDNNEIVLTNNKNWSNKKTWKYINDKLTLCIHRQLRGWQFA